MRSSFVRGRDVEPACTLGGMHAHFLAAAQGGTEDLTGLVGWVAGVVAALGPVGVGLMVALENVFPPHPQRDRVALRGFHRRA